MSSINFLRLSKLFLLCGAFWLVACGSDPQEDAKGGSDTQSESRSSSRSSPSTSSRASIANIDTERIIDANKEPGNWLAHGRTYDEQRFSPLNRINTSNVGQLKLAYYFDTGTSRGHEASPIVVDNILYTTSPWSIVHALDATTGNKLWTYDPQVPKAWGQYACCDVVNRGVAVWKGKVYVGTLDGHLAKVDARSGRQEWKVLTVDTARPYTITGAPRIIDGLVIIGNGGAELGVRGYVSAYSADSGELVWRFYTVPGNPADGFESEAMRVAAETWSGGEWWEIGGGGTVWDSMAYDPELDLLYIGTGNGSPWNRHIRSPGGGDNLYLSSIVALRPKTGEYVWHYQTTPGDTWDYTATQHMILADMQIEGRQRKVIMQAPKNGFFYVIDRVTGEFISADTFVDNVTWALGIDENGRPIENPETNYHKGTKLIFPSPIGAHNWQPMAYHPLHNLVYIPAQELPFNYGDQGSGFSYLKGRWNLGIDIAATLPPKDPNVLQFLLQTIKGKLIAYDPVAQEARWTVDLGVPWNGGVLATAGNLVFQGTATGLMAAYNAETGEKLWQSEAQTGIIAPPVTFEIDGKQYLAIMAGYGGAHALTSGLPARQKPSWPVGRLLVYTLDGTAELPPLPPVPPPPTPPSTRLKSKHVSRGELLFHEANCSLCHGAGAVNTTPGIPDLRYMTEQTHEDFFSIVYEGTLAEKGMVGFDDLLSEKDVEYIRSYLIFRAWETKNQLEEANVTQ